MRVSRTSRLRSFLLRDLQRNYFCYRHNNVHISQDTFRLRQGGNPALSDMILHVAVDRSAIASRLRRLAADAPEIRVAETVLFFILTERLLDYGATGVPRNQIIYTVDIFPKYVSPGSAITLDAGRLVDRRRLRRETTTGDGLKVRMN